MPAPAPVTGAALARGVAGLRAGRMGTAGSAAAAPNVGVASAAAAGVLSLSIPVADLLANDRPGPSNESTQSLTVTAVTATASTHGTVTLVDGVVTYVPDVDFVGSASFTYTACDDGTTAGQPDPLLQQRHGHRQGDLQPSADGRPADVDDVGGDTRSDDAHGLGSRR